MLCRRAYKFRLYLTPKQQAEMMRQAGARRWAWNWGLARRNEHYRATGQTLKRTALQTELTALKRRPGTEWLKGADAQLLQMALRSLDRAYDSFFNGHARFPKFKSRKKDDPTFSIPQRVKLDGNRIYIPKVGWVKVRVSRPVDGVLKTTTFKRDRCGDWYACLSCEFEVADHQPPRPGSENIVGVDMGVKDVVTLSTGEAVACPRYFRRQERALRRAMRSLARKCPGGVRRGKQRLKVARLHRRVARQRSDFTHKLSNSLLRQFDYICIEDLTLTGLVRTKLGKSFSDAGCGELRRQLSYKATWRNKKVVVIGTFFPSSKKCSACGTVRQALSLSDRSWVCHCGATHDRDVNAAVNIRAEGLRILAAGHAESRNARGPHVRPRSGGSAGRAENPPRPRRSRAGRDVNSGR